MEDVTKVEDTTMTVEELRARVAVFDIVGIVVVERLGSDWVTSVVASAVASEVSSVGCVVSDVKSDVVVSI